MNPFDLRGPEFLAFYVVVAIAVVLAARFLARWSPGATPGVERVSDPYALALLRAGTLEAARTAAVTLTKRGLLLEKGGVLRSADGAEAQTSDPLERAVLERAGRGFKDTVSTTAYDDALAARRIDLRNRRLLASFDDYKRRAMVGVVAGIVLFAIAQTKVGIAHERGRTNVGILRFLSLAAPVAAVAITIAGRRTPLGDRTLSHLKTLLVGVKARANAKPDALEPMELALLVGVFGASGTPSGAFPASRAVFFPPPPATTGSSCGSTSSCGSGSSCGGGCGGGGCGGCGS
ncbi:MAG: TIGR04222 domain-containing membrane protein [Planctomycetes bacterium]|nr:TIGR04222 domain-containing membrane protein [Planctomycetota bacterium]